MTIANPHAMLQSAFQTGAGQNLRALPADRPVVALAPCASELPEEQSQVRAKPQQKRPSEYLGALVASTVLAVLWEVAPRLGWIDKQFFPPPSIIIEAAAVLIANGDIFLHVAVSLFRALFGFVIAIAVAIPAGVILSGRFPRATQVLSSLFSLLGQVNAFTLFPLFVLFFGIGEAAKFGIIFWSCLWPVLGCTILGVRKIDPTIVKGARALGCDQATLFREVLLPAALPAIFSGARVGAGVAFLMLAAAEMIGAQTGVGWLVHNASMNYNIPRLYVAAVTIGILGISIERSLLALENHVIRWRPDVAA